MATTATRVSCVRCGGAGGWVGWPGFTCYLCQGEGYRIRDAKPVRTKRAKLPIDPGDFTRECKECIAKDGQFIWHAPNAGHMSSRVGA